MTNQWDTHKKICSHAPEAVFSYGELTFYGTTFNNIDKSFLEDGDLIVNCGTYNSVCGDSYISGAIKKSPTWLDSTLYKVDPADAQEIWLEWSDFSTPRISPKFWSDLLKLAVQNGRKRIICTCTGGHGRTGTALGAFMVAAGKSAADALKLVREYYCNQAIENNSQALYLHEVEQAFPKKIKKN